MALHEKFRFRKLKVQKGYEIMYKQIQWLLLETESRLQ